MFINADFHSLESYAEKKITVVGLLATFIGIISFLPVLLVVHKTRNTKNFPYRTLFLALASNVLWLTYGILKNSTATIIMGVLYFLIYTFILYNKIYL